MLRGRDVEEVVELKRQGLSIRAISRLTGYDRTTITKYLSAPAGRPVYGPRIPVQSKLEPFKSYLKERLRAGVWNGAQTFPTASGCNTYIRSVGCAHPSAQRRRSAPCAPCFDTEAVSWTWRARMSNICKRLWIR